MPEDENTGSRHRVLILAVAAVAIGALCWLALARHKPATGAAAPAVAVTAATATLADVPVSIQALGAAQAWQGVVIRPQVSGRLQRVAVQEGAEIKAGDLIAEIDAEPYRAALMQAQGALKRDQAQLELAQVDLARYRGLAAHESIATQQVDTQQALVKQLEGTLLLDQGLVRAAQINLDYCRIVSPVAGRVGVRLVDAGNLVSTADSGGIVTINQLEPIAVTFSVPQTDFRRLAEVSNSLRHALSVKAYSQEDGQALGTGELSVADNHVDAATGTVQLKARFENAGRELWPGQFVNVQLTLTVLHDALTIPKAAVNHGPDDTYVYVIGTDHTVAVRPITVALIQDANAVIRAGLKPGETVVTDGQMSLKAGSAVQVRGGAVASATAAGRDAS